MSIDKFAKVLNELGFDESCDIVLVNGDHLINKYSLIHTPNQFALYFFRKGTHLKNDLNQLIQLTYGNEYHITHLLEKPDGSFEKNIIESKSIYKEWCDELDGYYFFEPVTGKESLNQFLELIAHLRAPDGCPWDRKQTLQTLRTNLLEETHEVLEAIDNNDVEGLEEELGDLLLQIVLQAQIGSENQLFNIYDVINGIQKKLIFRHPHVFGDIEVKNVKGVLQNWEKWKAEERITKNNPEKTSLLATVPKTLPALSLAQKYQERAARVGFDWPDVKPVFEKVEEEIEEVKNANNKESLENELGDLLFAIVNFIRWNGFDAESLLRKMNQRFLNRFNFIENEVERQSRNMTDLSLSELDAIWEMAKKSEVTKARSAQ